MWCIQLGVMLVIVCETDEARLDSKPAMRASLNDVSYFFTAQKPGHPTARALSLVCAVWIIFGPRFRSSF